MVRYYSLVKNESKKECEIQIFGDITSFADYPDESFLGQFKKETDYSAHKLSKQLQEMNDVDTIHLHINSYGGEVAEGLAIYNALRNHKAKVIAYCDGFACSIASVIFMAGDERIMSKASLLMIHNAWIDNVQGNAHELRKVAEDLDVITSASINAYMEHVNITEKKLKKLLDNETFLTYQEALEMGFATSIGKEDENKNPSQSVKCKLIDLIKQSQQAEGENNDDEPDDVDDENKSGNPEPSNDDSNKNGDDLEDDEPDDEDETEDDEGKATERAVAFFNAIIGGIEK